MSVLLKILSIYFLFETVTSDPINRHMKIDGDFDDWKNVPSYSDPEDNMEGTVYDVSPWFPSFKFPDCHDGDSLDTSTVPKHIYNPNVNIVELKVAHDNSSLYIYCRVIDGGVIGKTSVGPSEFNKNNPSESSAGRFYIMTAINIDHNATTGCWLHDGGYHPTAPGFDGNIEIEFYNGSFNQNYFVDHGANNDDETNYLKQQNKENHFVIRPATHEYFTQYIYWNHQPTANETKRCLEGPYQLPGSTKTNYICFTKDKAPGPFNGVISYARSVKGNELELRAPFQALLLNSQTGRSTLELGMTVNISLSLETSEEYSVPQDWSSDTTATIQYTLSNDSA
ncbi:unnamed protein product [Adineta ricciae]|uniref:Uncharacterized protein n=1 Tax=Adineta ricciae TaxID=249248 RepID=A0A815VFD4_ADIRI|nr:unnamed protein product [Adineta ricciae]CAF1531313.1 unnamed protein product [Adineta ricciae]